MSTLDTLNALGTLASLGSTDTPAPASGGSPATASNAPQWLTGKLAQVSMIVLGLLLIAAGLFSFDKTRELIVKAGKTTAAAA